LAEAWQDRQRLAEAWRQGASRNHRSREAARLTESQISRSSSSRFGHFLDLLVLLLLVPETGAGNEAKRTAVRKGAQEHVRNASIRL